jgi:hypothetical protein
MYTATFNIRKAVIEDFFAVNNTPHWGAVYFLKNSKGEFVQQPYYLRPETDKKEFNEWFKNGQVYVFNRLFEPIEITHHEDIEQNASA